MKQKTRKMVLIALLVSQAIVLGFIERMIPLDFAVPGAKLGLSNIITLVSLYILSPAEAFMVLVSRILLATFLFGSISSLMYAFAGGMLAFAVMLFSKKYLSFILDVIGISILGAVFHNVGQLLMASIIIESSGIFYYLPMLLFAAIPTGLVVGTAGKLLIKHLRTRGV